MAAITSAAKKGGGGREELEEEEEEEPDDDEEPSPPSPLPPPCSGHGPRAQVPATMQTPSGIAPGPRACLTAGEPEPMQSMKRRAVMVVVSWIF